MEAAIRSVNSQDSRRRRLAEAVLAERVLHGRDALVHREQLLDFSAREKERAGDARSLDKRNAACGADRRIELIHFAPEKIPRAFASAADAELGRNALKGPGVCM